MTVQNDEVIRVLEACLEETKTYTMDNAKALMQAQYGESAQNEGRARMLAALFVEEMIVVRMMMLKAAEDG